MYDTRLCFVPWVWEQTITKSVKWLYIFHLSVWIFNSYSHRFWERKRKDYFVMFGHHITTIALMVISQTTLHHRIGALVLLVHEFSDIFVDMCKLTNLLKLDGKRSFFSSELCFFGMLFSWCYIRLYILPAYIIWPALRMIVGTPLYFPSLVDQAPSFLNLVSKFVHLESYSFPLLGSTQRWYLMFTTILMFLTILLVGLHALWFFLMMRIATKLVTGVRGRDAGRQEYEGDSDSEDEPEPKPSNHSHGE